MTESLQCGPCEGRDRGPLAFTDGTGGLQGQEDISFQKAARRRPKSTPGLQMHGLVHTFIHTPPHTHKHKYKGGQGTPPSQSKGWEHKTQRDSTGLRQARPWAHRPIPKKQSAHTAEPPPTSVGFSPLVPTGGPRRLPQGSRLPVWVFLCSQHLNSQMAASYPTLTV